MLSKQLGPPVSIPQTYQRITVTRFSCFVLGGGLLALTLRHDAARIT